mmetsp:Transcript_45596/g.135952  ORF Transcript_45596/g.135952 Transcript_45596/m.135952 type:complete len:212 (-) Transcript_45596:940-1575(-)|eukprot:358460-Chlamydomonas_euryale.AAC.3
MPSRSDTTSAAATHLVWAFLGTRHVPGLRPAQQGRAPRLVGLLLRHLQVLVRDGVPVREARGAVGVVARDALAQRLFRPTQLRAQLIECAHGALQPWVLQSRARRQPVVLAPLQAPRQKVGRVFAQPIKHVGVKVDGIGTDCLGNGLDRRRRRHVAIVPKREAVGVEPVEHDAEAPHVGGDRVVALKDLGRHERKRARAAAQPLVRVVQRL